MERVILRSLLYLVAACLVVVLVGSTSVRPVGEGAATTVYIERAAYGVALVVALAGLAASARRDTSG